MVLPDYVWIVHNWYTTNWWKNSNVFKCTPDQIRTVLNYQIAVDHYPRINKEDENKINIGGIVRCLYT